MKTDYSRSEAGELLGSTSNGGMRSSGIDPSLTAQARYATDPSLLDDKDDSED